MMTQIAGGPESLGGPGVAGRGNRLIPEPGGDTDNPREEP